MRRLQRGMSLAEAVVALAIIGMTIAFSMKLVNTSYRATQDNINKQFATQKAISMLEELRALVQTQDATNINMLDAYDDGVVNQPVLTTDKGVTDPAVTLSGNTSIGNNKWLYERRVTVQKVPGANDLRIVNVKVFANVDGGPRLLAEVASVLSTIGQNTPPTQVYDIYLVAIENIPGWWLYMQNIVPYVESAMNDLESRQPGLQFRRHWIRKLSYGRDPYYTPYVNKGADSNQPIDSVYFYPGLMPSGSAVDNYYPPDFFTGRVNIDGSVSNGYDVKENQYPYSLADQYNNGMRYQDELNLFNARVGVGLESQTEPTLRLLLDDMYMHPAKYRNAMVINLHGELFPFPPVRNYSDPAKDPSKYPNVRVVTHPDNLHYGNADNVSLRVYSYHNAPNPATVSDWLGKGAASSVPITVTVKGVTLNPTANSVIAVAGGVDFNGDGSPDPYTDQFASTTSGANKMWWSWTISGGDTIFSLYNSPLKSPCVTKTTTCDQGGLNTTRQLYGQEYIPAPVENLTGAAPPNPFQTDLSTAGDVEKNTARWIIQIPSAQLPTNAMLTIETRIGSDVTTGTVYPPPGNAPTNLSRTYAWRGTDQWLYGDATNDPNLPITERFQFLGDPRHCPYADLKMPHLGSGRARANQLGMGYNRYFDDFDSSASNNIAAWPGWSYDAPAGSGNYYGVKNNAGDATNDNDGWDTGSGTLEIDIQRMFQVLRQAVVRSHSVYTTMTGFSYYYVGIGNEIGYDSANGFANSIPVSSKPFDGSSGTRYEQSITNATINSINGGVKYIRDNSTAANYWWSLSWLGELAPDSQWNTWSTTGNLPTGTGAGKYSRALRGSITSNLPTGTDLTDAVRRTNAQGSTTFFWSGSTSSTFHHRYQDGTDSNIDTDGKDIRNTYNFPLADSIPSARPFDINVNDTSMNPDHFLQPVYGNTMTLSALAHYYKHSTNIQSSSLLAARDGNDAAFVVVNGLSPTGESGVSFIARWSFLSLVQSYMAGGLLKNGAGKPDDSRVRELPRVSITSPNDSTNTDNITSLNVAWTTQWLRWDGLPYTPAYGATFAEDTSVSYVMMYSKDNGKTWLYLLDDQPATPGVKPGPAKYLTTATSYVWSVPVATFPKGNYVVRVEAYRDAIPLHYSFHQYRVFLKR